MKRLLQGMFVLTMCMALAPLAAYADHARGHGHDGDHDRDHRRAFAHRDHDRDFDRDHRRPPGWDHGRKRGWGDRDEPPGLAKKHDRDFRRHHYRRHYPVRDARNTPPPATNRPIIFNRPAPAPAPAPQRPVIFPNIPRQNQATTTVPLKPTPTVAHSDTR